MITTLTSDGADASPILLVPHMWIGDFVRSHTVVRLLNMRWPGRPVDVLATTLTAELVEFMPGVRKAVLSGAPVRRIGMRQQVELAGRLREERYGTALITSRTWKSAVAPFLARIPERVGFIGEGRFFLINDMRFGERRLARMVDRCGALALARGAAVPDEWPLPHILVPADEAARWRASRGLADDGRPVVAIAPGAVGPGKRWPAPRFRELALRLVEDGCAVWILGGANERPYAAEIAAGAGPAVVDLTGNALRDAVLALGCAAAAVTNDSGLLHIAAAIGTPTVGIFGPTDPRLWAPLNPLAAVIEPGVPAGDTVSIDPTHPAIEARRVEDVTTEQVLMAVRKALAGQATSVG